MREVELRRLHQAPLGGDPLEEGDELELEEDYRVDGGSAQLPVAVPHQVTDEGEVEFRLKAPVEVVWRDERVETGWGEKLELLGAMAHHLTAPPPTPPLLRRAYARLRLQARLFQHPRPIRQPPLNWLAEAYSVCGHLCNALITQDTSIALINVTILVKVDIDQGDALP